MPKKNDISTLVLNQGKDQIKIHAISTGKVAVRPNFKKKKGPGFIAKINMMLDTRFT